MARKLSTLAAGGLLGLVLSPAPALALDTEPVNYIPFPSGTNLLFGYYQYFSSGRFIADNGSRIPNSEITANLGIARHNHYGVIGGMPFCTHVILPFGTIESARIGGEPLTTKNGLGDLIAGVTLWPIHSSGDYGTKLGVSLFFIPPTGTFNPNGVGLGSGAFSVDSQLGIVQHFGDRLMISSIFEARFQANHSDEGKRFSTNNSYQIQTMLGYSPTPKATVWAGYSGQFGGESFVDRVYTGQKTRVDEVRLYGEMLVAPTWEVNVMVAHDVSVVGGFQKGIYSQIRVIKAFWGHGSEH